MESLLVALPEDPVTFVVVLSWAMDLFLPVALLPTADPLAAEPEGSVLYPPRLMPPLPPRPRGSGESTSIVDFLTAGCFFLDFLPPLRRGLPSEDISPNELESSTSLSKDFLPFFFFFLLLPWSEEASDPSNTSTTPESLPFFGGDPEF